MATESSSIRLVVQNGPNPGQVFVTERRPQTIGRGSVNDFIIVEPSLAKQHARIRAGPGGFMVEDLGSTTGTFVNRQRVTGPTPLHPGDILQLGHVVTFSIQSYQLNPDNEETIPPITTPIDLVPLVPPNIPPPMTHPVYPARVQGGSSWFWIGVGLAIIALILITLLAIQPYFSFLNKPSSLTAETTQEAAIQMAQPEPTQIPTSTYTPTPTPTFTPTLPPTPTPQVTVGVPGIPALAAEEQVEPQNVSKIDAFCNSQVEVKANEPILIGWQQQVAPAGEPDYLVQWLENVSYDVYLDGLQITDWGPLNYSLKESCDGQSNCLRLLNFWVNVGLLRTGTHHLTLEWYTTRAIYTGFDQNPADGKPDIFGPGQAGEGFCDIIVLEAATPTPTLTPTSTPTSTPVPTSTPLPMPTSPPAFGSGVFQDFEQQNTWKIGDQKYGEFSRSSSQAHSGAYAGQLSYNFPGVQNDFVVFKQSRRLAGRPEAISAWVYGDNSGDYLNVWIQDAGGEIWAMTFGQIRHNGWQEMTARLDPSREWPSGPVSGPNNGVIDYPISFYALVFDNIPDFSGGQGVIYIDDLSRP